MRGDRTMATSRGTENRWSLGFWKRLFSQFSRYDLVLAVIPLLFALALAVYALTPVSLETALASGGLLSALCFVDAVYLNPPTDVPPEP